MLVRPFSLIVAITIGLSSAIAEEGPQTTQQPSLANSGQGSTIGTNHSGSNVPYNSYSSNCTTTRIDERGNTYVTNGCSSNYHQQQQPPRTVTIILPTLPPPPPPEPAPLRNLYRFNPAGIFIFKKFECSEGRPTKYPLRNQNLGTSIVLQENSMEIKTRRLQQDDLCETVTTKSLIVDENEMETKTERVESNCAVNANIGQVDRLEYRIEHNNDGTFLKLAPVYQPQLPGRESPCFDNEKLYTVYEMIFSSPKKQENPPVVTRYEEVKPPPRPRKPYSPKKVDLSKTKYCRNESALDKLPMSRETTAKYIVVSKKRKRIYVLGADSVIRYYNTAFGSGYADGPKEFQNDGRTPEGLYSISSKTSETNYHRALVVSYPNKADQAFAWEQDKSAGGDIMIHGFPTKPIAGETPDSVLGKHPRVNWTLGCMAVTNQEIEEIYSLVPDKGSIPVEICPL